MWILKTKRIAQSTIAAVVHENDVPMSFASVASEWQYDEAFRNFWVTSLRAIELPAYCFEVPPLTRNSMNQSFECVFVESPSLLDAKADPGPFAQYFKLTTGNSAVRFKSLGGDAVLVAPCPIDPKADYAHLASFNRSVSDVQASALWKVASDALEATVGQAPIWLSTAGLGVSWLHVRLDTRPKYYRHRPYASTQFWN